MVCVVRWVQRECVVFRVYVHCCFVWMVSFAWLCACRMTVLQMFWKLRPSGLSQLEFSKLVQQLHYAAPVSSSSLFYIDTSPFSIPLFSPSTPIHLASLYWSPLCASGFGRIFFNLPVSVNSHLNSKTNEKEVIKYVYYWQTWSIFQSEHTTVAINLLCCSLFNSSDSSVIPYPSRTLPPSLPPTHPSPHLLSLSDYLLDM